MQNSQSIEVYHHAKGIDDFVTWIEETPPCIKPLVFQDALSV